MYTLLVVDDEELIRKGITKLIDRKSIGIQEIYEADNGTEALAYMEKQAADIVLADINMPHMNGLDFAKKVKQRYPFCKIALLTGYDYLDYAIQAVKIGVDDYLLKPASRDDIQALLLHLVESIQKDRDMYRLQRTVEKLKKTYAAGSLQQQMAQIITDNLGNANFSLQLLAQKLGYNISYLSSIFKQHFGMSFRDYLMEQRLEQAKLLMLTTPLKNYEIAEAVGICDANYFSTCFKRRYHETITDFRNGRRP